LVADQPLSIFFILAKICLSIFLSGPCWCVNTERSWQRLGMRLWRQRRMQMRWRLWVRLHFVVTGLGLMGHSVATPRNPQRPFFHTQTSPSWCAHHCTTNCGLQSVPVVS
jgi:hypothetical protein